MSDQDYFADVRGILGNGYGSLGGDGAEEVERVQTKPQTREGAHYGLRCQYCGHPVQVDLTWDEQVYVAHGQVPPGWQYEPTRGAMRPHVGCKSCNVVIMFLITPDECARNLHAGEAAGYIPPGYANAMGQRLRAAGAVYRR